MKDIKTHNKQILTEERQQNPQPAKDLKVYEGEFENKQFGKITIKVKNNKLWLLYRSQEVPLTHWNGDEFHFAGNDLSPIYSGTDEGHMEFGFHKTRQKADVCFIDLMYDHQEDLFRRVEK